MIQRKNSRYAFSQYLKNSDIEYQIRRYKWKEVIKFMQANPHLLMQLLTINKIGKKQQSS